MRDFESSGPVNRLPNLALPPVPLVTSSDLLPSGSEQNQVLRGSSIPKEYFVIGKLRVKVGLKVVRVVGNVLSKRSKTD